MTMTREEFIAAHRRGEIRRKKSGFCPVCGRPFQSNRARYTCEVCSPEARKWAHSAAGHAHYVKYKEKLCVYHNSPDTVIKAGEGITKNSFIFRQCDAYREADFGFGF